MEISLIIPKGTPNKVAFMNQGYKYPQHGLTYAYWARCGGYESLCIISKDGFDRKHGKEIMEGRWDMIP